MSTIQDRIRIFMHFKKLNATQLAEIIDVQRSSVSHVLNGRNKPSLEFVQRLVSEFPEVSFEWLVNGSGQLGASDTNVSNEKHSPDRVGDTSVTNKNQETLQKEPITQKTTLAPPSPTEDNKINNTSSQVVNTPIKTVSRVIIFYTDGTFEEVKAQATE